MLRTSGVRRYLPFAIGLLLPLGAAALVVWLVPATGPLSRLAQESLLAGTFAVGLLGGLLLRRWWAVLAVPAIYAVAVWGLRLGTCTACGGPSSGIGLARTLGYALLGLAPLVMGALIGIWSRAAARHQTVAEKAGD